MMVMYHVLLLLLLLLLPIIAHMSIRCCLLNNGWSISESSGCALQQLQLLLPTEKEMMVVGTEQARPAASE